MTISTRIRVVVYNRSPRAELHRTLVSLACQDIGAARLDICLASARATTLRDQGTKRLLDALALSRIEAADSSGLSMAQAVNSAASGNAGHLAFVPAGTRLHPQFLSRLLGALDRTPEASAAYSGHTAGNAEGLAFVRTRPFRQEMLTRRNPVGPAALITGAAWQKLGGLRPGLWHFWWDLWLRLALGGSSIVQVPELLASCPPVQRLGKAEDGAAKALLVTHTPGAFEPDVCRWAMAHLRGDSWAGPFERGRIPGPRDVLGMWAGFSPAIAPGSEAWGSHLRRTA